MRLRLVWLFWWGLDSIEPTILGHNATTCSRGNRNTKLLERRIHSPLAQQWILLLLLAYQVTSRQIDSCFTGIGVRFIRKTLHPFLDPSLQNPVNRWARDLQIASNRRNTPALGM